MRLRLKKLFQYGFMVISLLGNTLAADDGLDMEEYTAELPKSLVIGCRPWDENIQGVDFGPATHFVDFRISELPDEVPPYNFHHLDVNDEGWYSRISDEYKGPLAGKFSEFAKMNLGQFETIVIDWGTCHHIKRNGAWLEFYNLLSPRGKLVVPVTYHNGIDEFANSEAMAEQMRHDYFDCVQWTAFGKVTIGGYNSIPEGLPAALLLRKSKVDVLRDFENPKIIIATKNTRKKAAQLRKIAKVN